MKSRSCSQCPRIEEFSLAHDLSTVGNSPRHQKCSRVTLLCENCIRELYDGGGSASSELRDALKDAYTELIRDKHKSRKHNFAFRGLLTCAHDDCTMTAELQKGKYIYYRCSGYRGKCETPYFREEEMSRKPGAVLKDIYVTDEALSRIAESLDKHQERIASESTAKRSWRNRIKSILILPRCSLTKYLRTTEGFSILCPLP